MKHSYDPEVAPDPATWLAWDEYERTRVIEVYHKRAGIRVPDTRAHALFHMIIENQIAENLGYVVNAIKRLSRQGLSRHDCIHAIASVLAEHIYDVTTGRGTDAPEGTNARYAAAVEKLDAQIWLDSNLQ